MNLSQKNILITGASSGIGRCIAYRAAEAGASVILCGRNEAALMQCQRELPTNVKSCIIASDLLSDRMPELVKEVVGTMGYISGFVHSAGIASSIPIRAMSEDDYMREYRVNVISGFEIAKILSAKKYLPPDGASYVFISSVTSHIGTAGKVSYSATKGAILSGARALAAELAPKKIRVNTISPGYVAGTGITKDDFTRLPQEAQNQILKSHPLGMGQPDDVAYAALFLLSDYARWITGTDICADGGYLLSH